METLWLKPADQDWMGDEALRPAMDAVMVRNAFNVATNAHAGILRKTGEPYINHPLRVAHRLELAGYDSEVVAIALMHDAVEDNDELTLQSLMALGFNDNIVSGVDAVTKRSGIETYTDAVARAAAHPLGRLVKLSDNLDNSSAEQLEPFSAEKREKQIRKYEPARVTLLQSITGGESIDPEAVFTNSYRLKMSGGHGIIRPADIR